MILLKCVVFISMLVTVATSCEIEAPQREEGQDVFADSSKSITNYTEVIANRIQKLEETAATAKRLSREGVLPTEKTEILYEAITESLSDLHEIIKDPSNAYIFLRSKGIDRVIKPNMDIKYPKLRIVILSMIKTMFNIAPVTTDATIPITTLDNILDIFENDDLLEIKAHVLDILYKWLPNNPKAQVRVMKLKGLEPFYKQATKLDVSVISTLLSLFNKILKEHIQVFQGINRQNNLSAENLILYKRIGLIERMSTATVCKGLLDIFKLTWSHNNTKQEVIEPMFEAIKNMKQYCYKVLRGNVLAIDLFSSILNYVNEYVKDFGNVSVVEMQSLLGDYVTELQYLPPKEEF